MGIVAIDTFRVAGSVKEFFGEDFIGTMRAADIKDRVPVRFAKFCGNILQVCDPPGAEEFARRHSASLRIAAVASYAAILFAVIVHSHTAVAGLAGAGEEFFVAMAPLQFAPSGNGKCALDRKYRGYNN